MLQILGLRTFVPKGQTQEKKYDKIFDINSPPGSVKELFQSLDVVLAQIPEKEHWNLFYTVANCHSEEKDREDGKRGFTHRVFDEVGTVAFDLDGIEHKYRDQYIETVCRVLQVDPKKTGIVNSGNGLHFLIGLRRAATTKDWYKKKAHHYKALCVKINKALETEGIPGKADPSVFEPRRILRLPGTVNRKPDKPEKKAELINPIGASQAFNFAELSGLPDVNKDEQLDQKILRRYPNVDCPAILDGCLFLKHCKDKPGDIDEPQWYAALSVTARMKDHEGKDGYAWSHELSQGHPKYSHEETEEKVNQALEASGPRTCESIGKIWDGCRECPNFQKVTSPILIKGEGTIGTEHTGFHNIPWDGKGKPTPNFEDLKTYFERDRPYLGLGGSGMVHVWNNTHYDYMENLYLDQFAQTHFNPSAKEHMRREFRNLIRSTNLRTIDWWEHTTRRKINFLNGYFDIDKQELRPHDPDLGFRYALPYEHDSSARAPTFEKMLALVTGGDEPSMKVLLEYMGYALSNDDCWAQKCLMLTGDGANGKSTFVNVLCMLAGDKNYAALNIEQINKSEYSRQLLDGKLFNVSEETPTKALLDSSTFKSLVTGGEVQVRSPYKEPYFIRNRAKLLFTCNGLPGSPDNTFGFYRRLIIIPFDQTFTRDTAGYDPHIGKKLEDELPGIFNLAMEGYMRLKENQAFTQCDKIKDTLNNYQAENDTVLFWAMENLVVYTNGGFTDHFAPLRELYDNYKYDTESQGRRPVNFIEFSKSLSRLGGDFWQGIPFQERHARQRSDTGSRPWGLKGIGVQSFS